MNDGYTLLHEYGVIGNCRTIAPYRLLFGGHPYGPDEEIARGRRTERIGGYVEPV